MRESRFPVAIAGLLQVLAVVAGFVALGIVLKMNGYPEENFIRWTPLARGLREHGWCLLLVPALWTIYVLISSRVDRGPLSMDFAIGIGFAVAICILIVFFYAACNSYSRPLILHQQQSR